MLLNRGTHGGQRILSAQSAEAMTTDQLSAAQKKASDSFGPYFDTHGWGFGLAMITGTDPTGPVGQYGWDGAFGTHWISNPAEDLIAILMMQREMDGSPGGPGPDFDAAVYQALAG